MVNFSSYFNKVRSLKRESLKRKAQKQKITVKRFFNINALIDQHDIVEMTHELK